MATEVTVPVLGESITEATLGEWLKQPGDPVAVDEPILWRRVDMGTVTTLVFVRRKNGSDVIVLLGQQKCKRLLRSA